MILERIFPGSVETLDLDDPLSRDRLLELYRPPRPEWLRLNLIVSVSGAAHGSDGTSETLSNPADRRILGVIRELADVVLVGAQSVRSEGYLRPRRSRLAILTASGDLAGHRIAAGDGPPVIVVCPEAVAGRVRSELPEAEIIALDAPTGALPVRTVVTALRDAGLPSIVCEGGPALAGQVVDAGLADEFCLATSARIGGAPFPVLGGSAVAEHRVELTQLLRDETSGLYARWSITG